ncbi:MAG: glycosyltransferase [Bacteroides sp.]
MISIVIPLYNKEKYIARAIHSIFSQTFCEFEIVVVNDGSTDRSSSIVEEMNHPLIRLINQENRGVSAARNRGIEESNFEYIAFLDADDEWKENHLAVIVELIHKYPKCGVFGTSYYFVKENSNPTTPILPNHFTFKEEQGIMDNYYEMSSGVDFPIHMSSYAVRKKHIQQIGCFPIGIPSGEDIITLARLHTICDFAYSKCPTSLYYLIYEGKNLRPLQAIKPIDAFFNSLLIQAAHRKGVRLFVSSWHKRRMVSALYAHNYPMIFKEFCIAFRLYPFQKKLYTSLLITIFSICSGKDLYTINSKLFKRKDEHK